jgi:hypothetical protein
MAKGDHIFTSIAIDGNPFTHHGIDCGNRTVIHYDGEKIARISRSEFGKGKNIFTKEYDECDPSDMVVQRAKSRLGEAKYHALTNNCEHFAYRCKTGLHKSEQVDTGTKTGSGGFKGAGAVGVQVVTELAQHSAYQALNPVAKGLIKIGLQKSPKVAVAGRAAMGIAGVSSVVSGLATELVVGEMLKEDKNDSLKEGKAKAAGKTAASFGTTVGGLLGTVAVVAGGGTLAVGAAVAAPVLLGVAVAFGTYHSKK